MTTGRINQVTAEERWAGPGFLGRGLRLQWRLGVLDQLLPIKFVLWSRMRPRMGFALVRITRRAGVSTRLLRIELA